MEFRIEDGDNFRAIGPWRIESGTGWRTWRRAALMACQRAAAANGDEFAEHLFGRSLRLLDYSEEAGGIFYSTHK